MAKTFFIGKIGPTKIMVNPSDVRMNAAGTNMTVATHSQAALDRGNRQPEYINWLSIEFSQKDYEEMEKIFNLKKAATTGKSTARKKSRKEERAIAFMAAAEKLYVPLGA